MAGPTRSKFTRTLWVALGLFAVGVGGVGAVLPGLPTTGPLIFAAWCFSKSSPRLEQWILDLPTFGPLIRSYRAGLGMSQRTKMWAISVLTVAVSLSVWRLSGAAHPLVPLAVAGTGLVGVAWIVVRVPTTEAVLAERARLGEPDESSPQP